MSSNIPTKDLKDKALTYTYLYLVEKDDKEEEANKYLKLAKNEDEEVVKVNLAKF